MARRFDTDADRDAFLAEPRLAILMYCGARPSPTGVPVWFDWDGAMVRMFAARDSAKVRHLTADPNVSVLVTNRVGEPEGWVAFDGAVTLSDFAPEAWAALIDRVAPRYWDLDVPALREEIAAWRANPGAFVAIDLVPERIRTGA